MAGIGRAARRSIASLLVAISASCAGAPAEPVWASAGTTIALSDDERTLWVTSPDDDAIVEIDALALIERRRLALAGAPEQLARAGDLAIVTLGESSEIARVDLVAWTAERFATPCGGTRGVAIDEDGVAWIACPHDARVLALDVASGAVVAELAVAGGPSAIAVAGERVVVTASRAGRVIAIERATRRVLQDVALESARGLAASQADAIAADARSGRVAVAFQRVDHDGDRDRDPARGGYGSVDDGAPRIEPRLFATCGARYARFDGGPRASSGPSALAWSGASGLLWVADRYTDDVQLLGCPSPATAIDREAPLDEAVAGGGDLEWRATFRVGRAPRGIVASADGRTSWVDLGFDHAIARLRAPGDAQAPARLDADLTRRRELGATRWSEAALRGRSDFHDAVDTHLTPSGVVTCATCHPGGGEDGLAWFLHTRGVARKLRRTPPAWGAREAMAPFHWDGEFASASTLTGLTIRELMEGDGLLVDLDAIAAYMREIPPPPPRPIAPEDAARVARGRALFESAEVGCAACHAGDARTDGARHDVLAPSADPDADLTLVDTPSLIAIRARAPYFHDGRAATLDDVLVSANPGDRHGRTSHLGEEERADLVSYLESL